MAMSLDLRPGAIIEYPYLWRWQQERGETEGRKERPGCAILALHGSDGFTHLALLAISSQPAGAGQTAIEVPEIELRRAGLTDAKRAWVTVSEYNYDVAERSWYLDVGRQPLGRFSKSFMARLATAATPLFRRGRARIDRSR